MSYDLAVIGAGPAGSSAARIAAKKGLKVALIDRRKKPGTPKQCAEGINAEAFRFLGMKPKKDWISNNISSCMGSNINGSVCIERPGTKGFILERKVFDLALVNMALDAGAENFFGHSATKIRGTNLKEIQIGNKTIKAKAIVAADGPSGSVARMIGHTPVRNGIGMQYEIKGSFTNSHSLQAYVSKRIIDGGWAWVFPKKNTLNVGIGSFNPTNLKPKLDAFVKKIGLNKNKILEVNGGLIPLHGPISQIYKDNVLFVGDAAGHTNPVSGGGIPASMFDGKLAAEVVADELSNSKPNFSNYQIKWNESPWKSAMDKSLRVQKFFLEYLHNGSFDYTLDRIGHQKVYRKRDMFKFVTKVPSIKAGIDYIRYGFMYYKPYKYAW